MIIDKISAIGVLLIEVLLLGILAGYVYHKSTGKILSKRLWRLIKKYSLILSLFILLSGTIISLLYSEVVGYEACILCWVQRALFYPQILFLGYFIFKGTKKVFNWLMGINLIGLMVAGYQYYTQITGDATTCVIGEISCSVIDVWEFGHITIPFMALVSFLAVLVLIYIHDSKV